MPIQRAILTAALLTATSLPIAATPATAPVVAQQVQNKSLSLEEAAALVQRRVGGRVLAADTRQGNGKVYYQIRVLVRKGQVKVYRVDPESGRIY